MSDADEKLDAEVAAFRRDPGDGRLSVLVEIDLPASKIDFPGLRPGVRPGPGEGRFSEIADPDEIEARVGAARAALEAILGKTPNWIGAAQVFVIDASADDLARIAELPAVRRVTRNRPLR